MAEAVINEILCIPGIRKSYAVEFSYVQEITQSMQITPIPCLPREFVGMSNYKGSIIPVIFLEEELKAEDKTMIMILRHQRYMLGIVISADAFIVTLDEVKKIENLPETAEGEIWKEKEIYQVEEKLYSVIDVEKTLESLVLYP
ncbi:chemotaxis protein CheW [Blautia schinkii]|nr:chemotaxis protein CheW [Blautia schinkii]